MIIVGYSGIGKTSCNYSDYIDLESSSFYVNEKRINDWYKVYVNVAENLSNQNYCVFISSHKLVREELNRRNIDFVVICPSLKMKEFWINKLKERYETTNCDKDYKSLKYVQEFYDENISDLMNEKNCHVIDNSDYNLKNIVHDIRMFSAMNKFKEIKVKSNI